MVYRSGHRIHVIAEDHRERVVSNGVLGMSLFVLTELMLFAGLVSAFTIFRAGALVWPPPGQPRLPFAQTAVNTLALLASGGLLVLARRSFRSDRVRATGLLLASVALGAFFVTFQGLEWVRMIGQGLTLRSSTLGSFFYLIVGMHALHAVAALGVLAWAWHRLRRGWLSSSTLATAEVFWYFVVLVWPLLYWRVYL